MISKLNTLIKEVDERLDKYEIFEAGRLLQDFTDELSNWYVRRGRERYWGSEMTDDKAAAYTTLYTVLVTLAKLTAPFTPFIAESIYRNLVPAFYKDAPESVHLCDFPVCDESVIDEELEAGMEEVLKVVELGRAARNASNIKNRQPLSKIMVASERKVKLGEDLLAIARDELNVKDFENLESAGDYIIYKLKPQLKTLGPKYGKRLGDIKKFLETCDAAEVVATVKAGRTYSVELGGETVEFTYDDLLISSESAEGYVSASDAGMTVVLDVHLTPELIAEGVEREIVSRLQTMRKEAGFEVTDRINVYYRADGEAGKVLEEKAADIAASVLAASVKEGEGGYTKEWELNGENIVLSVEKI